MSRIQESIRSAKKSQKPNGNETKSVDTVRSLAEGRSVGNVQLKPGRFATLNPSILERNRIIHDGYDADSIIPYKILRTRVLQEMDKNRWQVLAVTAAHEGAGKSVTSINLAITIAQGEGRNVYLLDVDLRKPGIAKSLGLNDVESGLGEYLSNGTELEDILWNVGIDNLVVIPGTVRFSNSSELLSAPSMLEIIQTIKADQTRPIVIVDLPPVLVTDDALVIAPIVDCLLFVVAEGETKRKDLTHSMELLRDVNLAGVVLNKSRDTHPGY